MALRSHPGASCYVRFEEQGQEAGGGEARGAEGRAGLAIVRQRSARRARRPAPRSRRPLTENNTTL